MEKIQKFENCKIENMQEIYGGTRTNTYGNLSKDRTDIKIQSGEEGSPFTIVSGLGFGNWISGNRTRTTMTQNADGYYVADTI